jgi:hypothetical protein
MRLIVGQEVAPDVLDVAADPAYGTGAFSLGVELKPGHYFAVAQRQPGSGFAASDFSLSWDSNVSVLYTPAAYDTAPGPDAFNPLAGLPPPEGIKLSCIEETDSPFDAGSDDIALELFADGVSVAVIPNREIGNFDTGDIRWLDPWLSSPVTYVERLELKFFEEDTFVDDLGSLEFPVAAKYRGGGRPTVRSLDGGAVVVAERVDFSGGTYEVKLTLA